jgi:guanylate kinase
VTPRGPRVRTEPGRLIVLSGPSGVGKDTVLTELRRLDPSLRYSVSYTTRKPRPGEDDGVAYSFVDEPAFRAMADRGEFLEWAEVHGQLYGTSEERVKAALDRGEDIVLKIDVQGAAWIRPRIEGAIFIFLLPPSTEELRRRLVARDTEDTTALELRVNNAVAELASGAEYDHRVVNDDVSHAAAEILDIVRSSRAQAAS